jgi:hypothetical protein
MRLIAASVNVDLKSNSTTCPPTRTRPLVISGTIPAHSARMMQELVMAPTQLLRSNQDRGLNNASPDLTVVDSASMSECEASAMYEALYMTRRSEVKPR